MSEADTFLANCRLADGRLVDIGISGGKIAVLGEGAASLSKSAPTAVIWHCRGWSMVTCTSTRR